MGKWSGSKVDPNNINKGNEYEEKDRVSLEAFNSIVNNAIYASEKSAEALEKANSAVEGNGTIVRVAGVSRGYVDFDEDPQKQLNSRESVETIYDYHSNDKTINWDKTSGIYTGTTIDGKDFSKYKRLRVTTGVFWSGRINRTGIVEISLEPNQTNVFAGGGVVSSYFEGTFYNYLVELSLNTAKTSLTFAMYRVTQNTDINSGFCVINKIEGVY